MQAASFFFAEMFTFDTFRPVALSSTGGPITVSSRLRHRFEYTWESAGEESYFPFFGLWDA